MEKQEYSRRKGVTRRDFLKISGLSAGGLSIGSMVNIPLSLAKDLYPGDKISLIVPYKAGGGYDIYLRAMSPYLTKYLKEVSPGARGGDVLLRNEPAAAGHKGYSLIFNAKPDGYTIGAVGSGSIIDNIVEKPEFDFGKLTFLLYGNASVKMIVTSSKSGLNSWNEVAAAMKKGQVKMAVGSFGRSNHTGGIIMNEKVGTNFKLVNFPGTVESSNALLRGDVQVAFCDEEPAQGLIEAKEIKVLLAFSEVSEYPGAVSIKELGFPELADKMTDLRFVVAPPGLEPESKNTLIEALKRTQNDKEFITWAKKFKFHLKYVYGDEARTTLMNFIKFYEEMAPVLKKYR